MEAGGASPQRPAAWVAAAADRLTRSSTASQVQAPSEVSGRVPGPRESLERTRSGIGGEGAASAMAQPGSHAHSGRSVARNVPYLPEDGGMPAAHQGLGGLRPQQETGEAQAPSGSLPRGAPAQERKILGGGLFGSRGAGMVLPAQMLPAGMMPRLYGRKDQGGGAAQGRGPAQVEEDWLSQRQGPEARMGQAPRGEALQSQRSIDHGTRGIPTSFGSAGSAHGAHGQARAQVQAGPQLVEALPVATVNQAMVAALAACQDEEDSTPSESNADGDLSDGDWPLRSGPHGIRHRRLSMDMPAGVRRSGRLSLDESAARCPVSLSSQRASAFLENDGTSSPARGRQAEECRDARTQQHLGPAFPRTPLDLRLARGAAAGNPLPPLARKPTGATPRGSATNTPRGSGVLQPVEDMQFPARGGERRAGAAVQRALGWIKQQKDRQGIAPVYQGHAEDPEFEQDFESMRGMLVGEEMDPGLEAAAVARAGARRASAKGLAGEEGGVVFSRVVPQVEFDNEVERMESEREARQAQLEDDEEYEDMRSSFLGSKHGTSVTRVHRVSMEDELAPPPPIPMSMSKASGSEPSVGPAESVEGLRAWPAQQHPRPLDFPQRRAQITRPRLSVSVGPEDDPLTCRACGCPCPPPGEAGFWLWVEGPSSWGVHNQAHGAGEEAPYGALGSLKRQEPGPAFGDSSSRSLSERQLQNSDDERVELLTCRSDQGGGKFEKFVQGRRGGSHRGAEHVPELPIDPPSTVRPSDRGPSRFEREASVRFSDRHGRESPSGGGSARSERGPVRSEGGGDDPSWMSGLGQAVGQAVSFRSDRGSGRLEPTQDIVDAWRLERSRPENRVGSSRSSQGTAGMGGMGGLESSRLDRGSGRFEPVPQDDEGGWGEYLGPGPMRAASTRRTSGSEDEANACPLTQRMQSSRRKSFQEGGVWGAPPGDPLARHPSSAFPVEAVSASGHLGRDEARRDGTGVGERAPRVHFAQGAETARRGAAANGPAAVKQGQVDGAGFDFSSGLSFQGVGSRRRSMERTQAKVPFAPDEAEEGQPSIASSTHHLSDESSMPGVQGRYAGGKPRASVELASSQSGGRGQGGLGEAEYLSYPLSKKEQARQGRISTGDAREAAEKGQLVRRVTTGHMEPFQLDGVGQGGGSGCGARLHYSDDDCSATQLGGEFGAIDMTQDEISVQKLRVEGRASLLKSGQ